MYTRDAVSVPYNDWAFMPALNQNLDLMKETQLAGNLNSDIPVRVVYECYIRDSDRDIKVISKKVSMRYEDVAIKVLEDFNTHFPDDGIRRRGSPANHEWVAYIRESNPKRDPIPGEIPTNNGLRIMKYSQTHFFDENGGSECSICLDEWDKVNMSNWKVKRLSCGHVFHRNCIRALHVLTCPLCRAPIHDNSMRTLHQKRNSKRKKSSRTKRGRKSKTKRAR